MERLPFVTPPAPRYRKVFVDSRLRSAGDYSSFQVTVPSDVQLGDRAYVASCSFANVFQTVGAYNTLYFRYSTEDRTGLGVPVERPLFAFSWRRLGSTDEGVNQYLAELDPFTNFRSFDDFADMMTARIRRAILARFDDAQTQGNLPRVFTQNQFSRAAGTAQVPQDNPSFWGLIFCAYVFANGTPNTTVQPPTANTDGSRFWIPTGPWLARRGWPGVTWTETSPAALFNRDLLPDDLPHSRSQTCIFRPSTFRAHRRTGAVVPSGNYDAAGFAAALQQAMRAAGVSVSVTVYDRHLLFTCAPNNMIQIAPAHAILDLPPGDRDDGAWHQAPANELNFLLNITGQAGLVQRLRSGLLDLFPYRSVYLHSTFLAANNTLAPSGLRDVLCRIPVDVEYGGIVQYVSRTSDDAVAIQPQQGATQVDFTFRDYRGQPIHMDGYVAIEIVVV